MREIAATWGNAIRVTWSIGWRAALYLIPAYILAYVVMITAMMAGDPVQGPVPWLVVAYYVLQLLWIAAVAFALVLAVKQVIGKSYSVSGFPPVPERFRIALIADRE